MRITHLLLFALLVLAALWRIVPHPDNMTPVMAVALFAGIWLKPLVLRIGAPIAVLLVSDLALGFHDTMLFVYAAMLLPVALAPLLRGRGLGAYAGASVVNALVFFVVTNLGVWLVSGMYAHDLAGLLSCFTLALPFLWKTLAGDLFFTVLFFVMFALAQKYQPEAELRASSHAL